MIDLTTHLKQIEERMDELGSHPSELTRDALLQQLRETYDAVRYMGLPTAHRPDKQITEPESAAVAAEPVQPTAPQMEATTPKEPEIVEAGKEALPTVEQEPIAEPGKKRPLIGKDRPEPAGKNKHILAGQLSDKPLNDLRSGIPLNEKYAIIQKLFKGNASDFGDAVLKLNNAANETEMEHYLKLYTERFDWDVESEAYQNFFSYVYRKKLTLQASHPNSDQ